MNWPHGAYDVTGRLEDPLRLAVLSGSNAPPSTGRFGHSLQLSQHGATDLLSARRVTYRRLISTDPGRSSITRKAPANGLAIEFGHQQRPEPIHDVGGLEAEDERPGSDSGCTGPSSLVEHDIFIVEPLR
jgi:hypothetical protein